MRLSITVIVFSFLAAGSAELRGEAAPGLELLKKAEAAALKLRGIAYRASVQADGELSKVLPRIEGRVVAERGPSDLEHRISIEGEITPSGITPGGFAFVSDGKQAHRVDHRQKLCLSGAVSEARVEEGNLVPPYYLNTNPFMRELNAVSLMVEPPQKVGEVECDVVTVKYDQRGDQLGRFYFGKRDHLLRRLDRLINAPLNGTIGQRLIVYLFKDLDLSPSVNGKTFKPECPAGYEHKTFAEIAPGRPVTAAASGSTGAADWTLKDSGGKEVSLQSLRGQFVVLDFWATWCGPCKMAMPGVQKIHDHFKGKPVNVFAANCWERAGPEGAIRYMKEKGYTYPQLLGADKIATQYGVNAIPTIIVLGKDGKVLQTYRGFNQAAEQQIIALIEEGLKQ